MTRPKCSICGRAWEEHSADSYACPTYGEKGWAGTHYQHDPAFTQEQIKALQVQIAGLRAELKALYRLNRREGEPLTECDDCPDEDICDSHASCPRTGEPIVEEE